MKRTNYEAEAPLLDTVYKVKAYHLLTPTVAQIFLTPKDSPLIYEAGQYLKVLCSDGKALPFSIANAPSAEGQLELHLLYQKENYRSLEILQQVIENQLLVLRGPFGSCTQSHLAADRPLIFIARGTGFAPIKAVIEALSQKALYPPLHFYWALPTWRDLYLHELIENWVKTLRNFHFTPVLTREYLPKEKARFGKLSPLVLHDYPDLSHHQVYASGPEAMIYTLLYDFQQHGLAKAWFYSDVFDYKP